jgi:hypothetical protein
MIVIVHVPFHSHYRSPFASIDHLPASSSSPRARLERPKLELLSQPSRLLHLLTSVPKVRSELFVLVGISSFEVYSFSFSLFDPRLFICQYQLRISVSPWELQLTLPSDMDLLLHLLEGCFDLPSEDWVSALALLKKARAS